MSNNLREWLGQLGLGAYAELLEAHAVDFDVLPEVTEGDLEKLGITLGHRKKLLRAIRELDFSQQRAEPTALREPAARPERRQLTVLICDLVDSTGMSRRHDPEDLSVILAEYQRCCEDVINRFHGTIARFMGDGVFCYFGYPQADEIDAERSIRAGLEIVSQLDQLRPLGVTLEVRVGIATGLVVIGETIGEGMAREQAVRGETPNLASRLMSLAEPGTLVVAEATRRLALPLFEFIDLGEHRLKGFEHEIRAWRVAGATAVQSRSEALHARVDLTALVGREEEVALAHRRWQQALSGAGQVLLISGEPGIGKSRLARTVRQEIRDEAEVERRLYCSPYHQSTALYPVIELLTRVSGLNELATADDKLDALEVLLDCAVDDVPGAVTLLADLLSIPWQDRYPPLNLTPQGRKQKTLETVERWLACAADPRPTLLMFEDLHWSDPTTRELLDGLIARAAELPVLMILTYRPEFAAPWSSLHQVTTITLKRLSPGNAAQIVDDLTGGKPLPSEVQTLIVDKTDGIPLYIEEVLKAFVEGDVLSDERARYTLKGRLPSLAVPSILSDSLMARLDRLGPVKQVAQMASAFGRQCSFGLLAAVSQLSDEQLQDALDQLSAAEVIHAGTGDRRSIYTFKHALLQDAAYSSMLRADKQQLHARIAEVLEDSYPEQVEYEPELVAHHCAGAGLSERAVGYWQKAGERAIRQSASAEAVDHLTKALALLETLPESRRRTEQELALQTSLGPALAASHGFSALDVEAAYARALALSRDVGDTTTTSTVQRGLWAYHFVRADLRAARELGDQLLELGRQEGDEGVLLESHRVLGQTLLCAGAFSEARDHLEQGIALYDPELHSAHSFVYGNDPGIVCASYRAYALWFLGRPSEARRQSDDVLVRARALGHPFSLAFALVMATYLRQHLGDVPGTRELADEGIAVTSQQGYPFWAHVETMLKGWTDAEQGDVEKGISQLRQGLNAYLALGSSLMCPMFLGLLAEACARAQRYEDGLEALDEALDRVAQTGERFRLAELHRLKGELLLRRDGSAAAEAAEDCFQNALDIARQQQALAWELRTAVSRARLWRSGRQARDAATQLRQVYERFDQGFDTADLSAARGLLAALAQA